MTKKAVFNRKIAQDLCKRGFKVVDMQPNSNKPWLNVYYFHKTEELLSAFDEILTKRNK